MDLFILPPHTIKKKIAAFDLDYTLICTKSGRRFPKDKDDWKLMYESVQKKLKELVCDDYSIVVFSNQKNLENRMGIENFKQRCMNIQREINVPISFYISSGDINYLRKPFTGMFEIHHKKHPVSLESSFYVGDAWCKKKCFSDSDMCFARNCGLTFYKAKDFFEKGLISYDFIPPSLFPKKYISYVRNQIKLQGFIKDKQYLFIISPPSSGKTYFCNKYLPEYLRLSKDDYTTPAKYRNIIKLNQDEKLVFDNTNYSKKSREKLLAYLDSSDHVGYIVRNIPKCQSLYLNQYRHFITKGDKELLPTVAIHTYYKRLDIPIGPNVLILDSAWILEDDLRQFYC